MVKRFHASRRSGFYLSITTAGELGAGDAIVVESVDRDGLTIADVVRAIVERDRALLERAVAIRALAASLRADLERLLGD
jgi:MOSC domain-containing protein YiiM